MQNDGGAIVEGTRNAEIQMHKEGESRVANGKEAIGNSKELEAKGVRHLTLIKELESRFGRDGVAQRNPQCIVVQSQKNKYAIHITKSGVFKLQQSGRACVEYSDAAELIDAISSNQETPETKHRIEANAIAKVTAKALMAMLDDQGYRCALTGRRLTVENLTLDHINPFAFSDDHTLDNVHLVTAEVNRAKGTMRLSEFIRLCNDVAVVHPMPQLLGEC